MEVSEKVTVAQAKLAHEKSRAGTFESALGNDKDAAAHKSSFDSENRRCLNTSVQKIVGELFLQVLD